MKRYLSIIFSAILLLFFILGLFVVPTQAETDQVPIGYQIAQKASGEVGYAEKTDNVVKYNNCYNKSPLSNGSCPTGQGVPWCTVFTSWTVNKVLGDTLQKYGIKPGAREWSVLGFMDWFKRNNGKKIVYNGREITIRWIPINLISRGKEKLAIGDIKFIIGNGSSRHSNVVSYLSKDYSTYIMDNENWDDSDYDTIDGNWDDTVSLFRSQKKYAKYLRGIGRFDDSLKFVEVSGKVKDSQNNQGISYVDVYLTPTFSSDIDSYRTQSNDRGFFIIAHDIPGRYEFSIVKEGYKTIKEQKDIRIGNNTFNFTMEKIVTSAPSTPTNPPADIPATPIVASAKVAGTVKNSVTSQAISGATVKIDNVGTNQTNSAGAYSLTINNVTPNQYKITVSATGYTSQNTIISGLQGGQTRTLNWTLNPTAGGTTGGTGTTTTSLSIYTKCVPDNTKMITSFDVYVAGTKKYSIGGDSGEIPNPNANTYLKASGCPTATDTRTSNTINTTGKTEVTFELK
ncbi:MAG: hypothetical protein CEN89_141 [Candidatus Berkelbacteria bacterium Licking1014_7]|uniref:Carboxypeptidase regulatory-like domain-containing protein n=1 Tax=Candidatus Berkelbacteria bacterium Licking1014_7 TaxID=2017147 RepID=A0A554LKH3_9BACT|nr:MAG: hypothetical protein CEN89_141 [Candidatus Berkelbacteria bacterium Licking1014_7]